MTYEHKGDDAGSDVSDDEVVLKKMAMIIMVLGIGMVVEMMVVNLGTMVITTVRMVSSEPQPCPGWTPCPEYAHSELRAGARQTALINLLMSETTHYRAPRLVEIREITRVPMLSF